MDVELLQDVRDISGFKTDWEQLFKIRAHEPSTSYEWTKALLDHHLIQGDEPLLMVCRQEQKIIALLLLVREKLRLGGLPLIGLRALAERSNTHSDLLCARLDEQLVEALIEKCRSGGVAWDYLRFTRVLENSVLDRALLSVLHRSNLRSRFRIEPPSFFLVLPDSFDNYLRQRSGKFRNHLRRMEKSLGTKAVISFTKVEALDTFAAAYDSLLAVERASWKQAHGTAISAVPHQTYFYHQLAKDALMAGRLHLTFLRLDGLPVAYNLGLVTHDCYYYLKTSFHEHYRRQGAATVSRARLIRMLIEEGVQEFDFPGEPYEWERQWADELRWHRSVVIYGNTFMGRLFTAASSIRSILRGSNTRRSLVYCDPKNLRSPSIPKS